MNMCKKISVIIPVYNSEKTIDKCIHSLINQTYNNLEILIINDGSSDNSKLICEKLAKEDRRIKLINNENHGVSYSRNCGMNIATGDYITFIDADDYIENDCFEKIVSYVANDNIDFIRYNFNSNKRSFNNSLYELKNKKINFKSANIESVYNHFFTSCDHIPNLVFLLLIKKDIADKIRFNEKLYMMEDVDFYIQLFQNSNNGFFADLKLYNYYINKESVTHNNANYKKNILGILETNKSIIGRLKKNTNLFFQEKVNTNHYRIITNIMIELNYFKKDSSEIFELLKLKAFKNLEKNVNIKFLPRKNKILFIVSKNNLYNLFVFFSKIIKKVQIKHRLYNYNIGILTINDNNNYGNRLQNYALQTYLNETFDVNAETIWNNINRTITWRLKREIKNLIKFVVRKKGYKRYYNFKKFTRKIKHSKYKISNNHVSKKLNNIYDYFITGSDQVWNPNHSRMTKNDLLCFADAEKRVSYAASFGVSKIEKKHINLLKEELEKYKLISVREDEGKKLIEQETGIKNVKVLIDPTMLLDKEQWSKIEKKPKQLKNNNYILCYFLGKVDNKLEKNINLFAEKHNLEIINILDENSKFYNCGPDEFLYLERNAKLICTDSFHSCVFAIIYNTPFQIFERDDEHLCMNSRLNTLLKKFNLEDRKCRINEEIKIINNNVVKINKILYKEKAKTYEYFYSLFKK